MAPRKKDVFVVDKILQEKKVGGTKKFLIKWKGFEDSHNSWEPEVNILDKVLIDEFRDAKKRRGRKGKEQLKTFKVKVKETEKVPKNILSDIENMCQETDSKSSPVETGNGFSFRLGLFTAVFCSIVTLLWGCLMLSAFGFHCNDN